MSLNYKLYKKGGAFFVSICEKGSKRRLYLDRLKSLAKPQDQKAIQLLIKLKLSLHRDPETAHFDHIEIPSKYVKELIASLEKTNRFENQIQVKEKKELTLAPELWLKDPSGCFADLWMNYGEDSVEFSDFAPKVLGESRKTKEEKAFESDLLEVGFEKKIVGGSRYYCPKENVKEALDLLSDVGWKILDSRGIPVQKGLKIREENGRLAITCLHKAFVDHRLQMEGEWSGDILYVKKSRVGAVNAIVSGDSVDWDENLRSLIEGFDQIPKSQPGKEFVGELLPHQEKGVDWLEFLYRSGFSALLADEMGLGKTVQVLAFLSQRRTNLPVLIVVPASLLFNWEREIAHFYPKLNYHLISYNALVKDLDRWSLIHFDVVVLDESSLIKQASTQRARAVCKLRSKFRICLNGTPMENRADEVWSQFHFLMPDLLERGAEIVRIRQRVRPFILRRKKDEAGLNLPEKIEQVTWLEMEEEQKAIYNECLRASLNPLEKLLRLRQAALDPRLLGYEFCGAKTLRLLDDLEQITEEKRKVLVFSQFSSYLKLIQKERKDALLLDGSVDVKKRGELVSQFQEDPETSVFLLSLKAGGVGLNLTKADYVYILDPWWNDAVESQAIDRAHRIGRQGAVIAKRMILAETVEEKMVKLKESKSASAERLLEELNESELAYLLG